MKQKRFLKNAGSKLLPVILLMLLSLPGLLADPGDVNNDSTITIVDALMVARHSVGITPDNFDEVAADVNGDGNASIIDALMIAQYYVGIITEFPVSPTQSPTTPPPPVNQNFIRKQGSTLYDGSTEYRFVSANIPNYLIIEDRAADIGEKWHRITEFEQRDAVRAIKRLGGQVFRTYTFSVQGGVNVNGSMAHIYRDNSNRIAYNEDLFRDMDMGLAVAGQEGVRMYIPLVDNWQWFGGFAEWATLAGGGDFWTSSTTKNAFKDFITWLVNRTNTVTGVKYKDDPTIMGWELGNEIDKANDTWISEMAAHIKSVDSNHLVIDGGHKNIPNASLTSNNIDVVTTHYTDSQISSFARQAASAGKAYIYGEYSPDSTSQVQNVIDSTRSSGAAGCLIWSLRFRTRYGGFYYHSDFNNSSDSLQYPGFSETAPSIEKQVFDIIKQEAYRIRGMSVPTEPVPPAPVLLSFDSPGNINWQGSAGAYTYNVQRRPGSGGSWQTVDTGISDAANTYFDGEKVAALPLYSDNPGSGSWSYRIIAVNPTGESTPSNIISINQ